MKCHICHSDLLKSITWKMPERSSSCIRQQEKYYCDDSLCKVRHFQGIKCSLEIISPTSYTDSQSVIVQYDMCLIKEDKFYKIHSCHEDTVLYSVKLITEYPNVIFTPLLCLPKFTPMPIEDDFKIDNIFNKLKTLVMFS
jgi:hypothetical protein